MEALLATVVEKKDLGWNVPYKNAPKVKLFFIKLNKEYHSYPFYNPQNIKLFFIKSNKEDYILIPFKAKEIPLLTHVELV